MSSVAMHGHAPYKQVLTHGFTVDANGKKMSKSLGNVVAPQDVTNKLGADILRLWVASTDYRSEITVSDEILKRSADAYRRIRNTARFLLSNLNGFDPATDLVAIDDMVALDQWAVKRAEAVQQQITSAYERYDLLDVTQSLMQFCSIEMGSFYLDIIKDRQYTVKADGLARRSCQSALYHIVEALVRWMAPVMSFTAQEVWQVIPGQRDEFVFTDTWYQGFESGVNISLDNDFWQQVMQVKSAVNRCLETARKASDLGGSLEAEVTLYLSPELNALLSKLENELRFVLICSKVTLVTGTDLPANAEITDVEGLAVVVAKTNAAKCVRCWHHTDDVGHNNSHPELCLRCVENVDGDGEVRSYA
jgi:isoleucyl-tRNA synthetase